MVAITAKLTKSDIFVDSSQIDSHIDMLLHSESLEVDMIGNCPSLDEFRKACLLAVYEFHQFPGHQSWLRIDRLTRMAYRVGLDRLENMRGLYSDWEAIGEQDMQEWRAVWWCIYHLDSYSNLATGTPFLIEDANINTSLIQCHPNNRPPDLYLPPRSGSLWEILPSITSNTQTNLRNINIITVAATRQVGLAARMHLLRRKEETITRLAQIERDLSALRLALPSGWLNPRCNAFSDEFPADHHARLITVLHIIMAQLLVSILSCSCSCSEKQDEDWLVNWKSVLESCRDIATAASAWNSSLCSTVDPAISLTIFTALVFLDLHQKSSYISPASLRSTIQNKDILRLQLEHFASIWTLPRLLTLSFKGFSESISGPLSNKQIASIMSRFEAPLHPRWLQFISSTQSASGTGRY
ncbi:unnamed protein product [Clonostachys chloroleuca]|uniref:Xylanolytic transcriptional activator regulatory domain-containing protein n=1 Tax=Clonostachys chloroleuca TaxID=1926264 RepID=A0AA35LQ46_9HYPO|nr:unnamed protein product [Clonostachys chloroleuca]